MSDSVISGIDHISVIVKHTDKALEFYCGILGLQQADTRPELGYAGAWLWVADQQIHLLELPNPDPVQGRPDHGGRDRHLALTVSDLQIIQDVLSSADIDYTLSKSGRRALFCRDYDGNAVEIIEKK